MIPWLLAEPAALGHAGDDHGAPPPPAAAAGSTSWTSWSSEFEAVLAVPADLTGEARLYVADFATSAPVHPARVTLHVDGAAHVMPALAPTGSPGVWSFPADALSPGETTAALEVMTEDRADLLGFPARTLGDAAAAHPDEGWSTGAVAALAAGTLVLGALIGVLLGRRRPPVAPLAALVVLALAVARQPAVVAHEGDAHVAPTPAAAAARGGTLSLPLASQFLLGLRTTVVRTGVVEERLEAVGVTVPAPGGRAALVAPVTGWFRGDLSPGDLVQAGDVLGAIEEAPSGGERFGVAATRAQAAVALAEAQRDLAVAERAASRAEVLGDVLPERERIERARALELARERVAQAERLVASVGRGTPTTPLRAPIAGRVARLSVRPGDLVQQGQPIVEIVGPEPLWAEVRVPAARASGVLPGARAQVHVEGAGGLPVDAVVVDAGAAADPRSGTVLVTLRLDGAPRAVLPGSTVRASIPTGAARRGLVVPDAAVVDAAGETLVFVKVAPEAFEERLVRVGPRAGDVREVVHGLDEGERVVVEATYNLRSLAGR